MTIAKRVAAEKRADRERVRSLNRPVAPGPDGEDHGLDLGPASLARPTTLQRVEGKLRGAGQRKATPVYARMVDCTDLFERLNMAGQLTDRQTKAGKRLLSLKRAAGLEPRVTAQHPVVHDQVHEAEADEVVEDICPAGFDPRTYYRHLLRQVPSLSADMLHAACDWTPERPTGSPPMRFLATFQEALNKVADVLGLKREGVGV